MRRIEMQVLEKILQEIEKEKADPEDYATVEYKRLVRNWNICIDVVAEIIRSHMQDEAVSNPCKLDDGWIPVKMEDDEWASETALPEENQSVWITIEWAGGERESREALFKEHSFWSAKHITCNRITKAWMPRFVPAPYQPKEEKSDGNKEDGEL